MSGVGENIFYHCGQNCPENTWERTNQSSGGGGVARQHLWRHGVAIGAALWRCALNNYNTIKIGLFIENKGVGENNHYVPEGTKESHPRVHDLRHPRLGKPRRGLQIMETRMGFLCPFRSVVIDSISHNDPKISKIIPNSEIFLPDTESDS